MAEAEINRKILSVGEKVVLQRNIEFIEFVETEDKLRPFQCRHCGQVAIIHIQLQCGHMLCEECFPILHLKRCPANDCNEYVEEKATDTSCIDHEISELKAFCKYHKRGCNVVVSLGDSLSHQRNCSFSKLTNEEIEELAKCKEDIRNLKRQLAKCRVPFELLIPSIQEKCLIPNKDTEDFILEKVKTDSEKQRTELEKQLTETFEKYIDSKMEIEQNKTETQLLSKYESDFRGDTVSLTKRLGVTLPNSLNVIWEIEDFNDNLSSDYLSIESKVFGLNAIGCKVQFVFHLYPFMCFEVKYIHRTIDEESPLNGHHRITFTMRDQVDNPSQHNVIRIFEPTFCDWSDGTLHVKCLTKDELSFHHSRWVKNGKIQVVVKLESLNHIIVCEPRQYGRITWEINYYNTVFASYKYGCQFSMSAAFYVKQNGYRMKVLLFVDDKVHFRLYLLKGPWDKELPTTFKHRTPISLVSEKDPYLLLNKNISMESDSSTYEEIHGFTKGDLDKYVLYEKLRIYVDVEALLILRVKCFALSIRYENSLIYPTLMSVISVLSNFCECENIYLIWLL